MMSDKQFSVPRPWSNDGRIMIDCYGDESFIIDVKGELIKFEWSTQFGPMPITKRGAERRIRGSHPFWRAVSLWKLQGKRVEGDKAIWHEPKKPVVQHLGGKHYRIIEHGEPGHDW